MAPDPKGDGFQGASPDELVMVQFSRDLQKLDDIQRGTLRWKK